DGRFTLRGVPAGEYVLAAWHERFGKREAPLTLGAGETKDVAFAYAGGGNWRTAASIDSWLPNHPRRVTHGSDRGSPGALALDSHRRRHHLDRAPLLLQLRERRVRGHHRRSHQAEGGARADAARALLVPLGRGVDLGDRRAAPPAGLLARWDHVRPSRRLDHARRAHG